MTQDKTGGYCSKCGTVWAKPGICNCPVDKTENKTERLMSDREKRLWNTAIEEASLIYTKYTTENPKMVLEQLKRLKK